MAERIDELQLLIGSDASGAIRQLGNLAGALDNAASSARKLSSATGFATHFTSALNKLSSVNLNRTIDSLERLSRLKLDNLKDKTVTIQLKVQGADETERAKYASQDAAKEISKNSMQIAKALGQKFNVDTTGIRNLSQAVKEMLQDFANGGSGGDAQQKMFDIIRERGKESEASIMGVESRYKEFIQYMNSMQINTSGITSAAERENAIVGGALRNLKGDAIGIDQIWGEVMGHFPDMFDAIEQSAANPSDQLDILVRKMAEVRAMLEKHEIIDDNTFNNIGTSIQDSAEKAFEGFDASKTKFMRESMDKIPIDLNIDQNRFETQIQQAITKATSKTYETQPIKLKLDNQSLRDSVEAAFSMVDIAKLPQFASNFEKVADAISAMNQTNIKDTGIVQFANALSRLVNADTSKLDPSAFKAIVHTASEISKIGDVSKSLNNFVSALARLANAGDKTAKTATGLRILVPRIREAVKTFVKVGEINPSITSFVASLAKLASAGDKTSVTAQNLRELAKAVLDFLKVMRNSGGINENIANTIQGLGNLASAGTNAGKAMNTALSGGGSNGGHGIASTALNTAIKSTVSSFKSLLSITLKLGGQGVSALGSFLAKLNLLPSKANSIDRTALSFTNLLRAVLPFYGIRGLFQWGKEALESGSAIVELENVIDTSFGHLKKGYEDISGYIYKWAETTIDAFGVSQIAAERYAGRLMAMFNSSGFDVTEGMRDSAAKMTTDLIERAGDVASFYDITVDEAMTKFQSGLAGMTRPLRSLGINMSVANMQAFALSQGITTAWKEMDQASQMALRYQYILNATQYAAGDFQKTQLSLANQCRLLSLNFQVLSTTIGQGLVSAIAPAIAWLNLLIKRLIQAATAFRTFMWTLFGKPLQAARGTSDEMAGYLDDASDAAGGLADSAGGASDGLGSAGKAAKNLKKQLQVLPFDELNQLAKDTASAGSGGGGGAGGGGGVGGLGDLGLLDGLDTDFDLSGNKMVDAINKWAAKIRKAFLDKDWKSLGKNIANFINFGFGELYKILDWKNIGPKVYGFVRPFQETFNSLMEYIDWDLIGRTFGRGLNDIVYILRTWINGFNWRMYGTQIATGMNSMLDEWDAKAFGQLIADKFQAAWDFFGGWVKKFDFKLFGTKMKEAVVAGFKEFKWGDAGESLAEFLNGISDTIIAFFEGDDVALSIGSAFSTFVNNFLETFDAEKAKQAMGSVKEAIKTALGEAVRTINTDELKNDLVTLFSGLPWGFIGGLIGAKVGFDLVKSLIGAAFTKSVLTSAMTSAIGTGGTAAATTAATGGATASAAAGASLTVGSIVGTTLAIAGITVGAIKLGQWLKKQGIGQLNTEGNKKKAAQTISEGQTKNNQGLASQGLNAAGYNTQLMTAPQQQTAPSISNTTLKVTQDPSVPKALFTIEALKANPVISKLLESTQSKEYKSNLKTDKGWVDSKAEKKVNAKTTNAYNTLHSNWLKWLTETITKYINARYTSAYKSVQGDYNTWVGETIVKMVNAQKTKAYNTVHSDYLGWIDSTACKLAEAKRTKLFESTLTDYDHLKDKSFEITAKIRTDVNRIIARYSSGDEETIARIFGNAKGGLFNGPTAFQVFGEAGDEAAIPLERKSTMRKIANAIVDSGGFNGANNDSMADAIAQRILPAIANMMGDANDRPVQVNATLYTENNEVLARAVTRGQKSIDKRYNPVSQFSY